MYLRSISLTNFRNFAKYQVAFDQKVAVIVGANTTGKTNILEAINLLSIGKSFRAQKEEEMIKNREEVARVSGQLTANNEQQNLEVVLARGQGDGHIFRKKLSLNGVVRRLYNFVGLFRTVLFGPWDLGLVTEAPSTRRKFLDTVLSQVDKEYRRSILSYEKGLRQRNKLLERIREGEAGPSQLLFWNQLLVRNGEYITQKREELINFTNLRPPLKQQITLEYDRSVVSQVRLARYAKEEIEAATTLVGPHRDDFKFIGSIGSTSSTGRDLAAFGSRSEQRMAVLWLKLAELAFIEGKTNVKPVLLLDDIFSELDHAHRQVVFGIVGGQQTIITTADPHTIEKFREGAQMVEL